MPVLYGAAEPRRGALEVYAMMMMMMIDHNADRRPIEKWDQFLA